jgi:hypothetical protein
MEDQGIMALPQAGMQAPTTAPTQNPMGDASIAAFEQLRMQADPREVTTELLSAGEQMDPGAVGEFKAALAGLNLPPEIIDALNQMVDAILAEPENYPQIRAELIAEGVPEDFLPEQFDPNFFGALNMALDQMSGSGMPMNVQQFAGGGIATLHPIAKALAAQGRNGDTMLAHITPAEARMLRRRGGSGTINPVTGLPEFFLKKLGRSIGRAFKSVTKGISKVFKSIGSAVKKFVSSKIGRIITTAALGFFLGPAAASFLGVSSAAGVAAVSGFIGSSGSTLLAGGSIKDALKAGAVGGLTAGALSGITGGASAFESGSYTGPTTISGQVERFTEGLKSLTGTAQPQVAGPDFVPGPQGVADVGYVPPEAMGPAAPMGPQPVSYPGGESFGMPTQMAAVQSPTMTDVTAGTTGQIAPQMTPFEQAYQNQSFNEAIGLGPTQPFASSSAPSNLAIERSALGMTSPLDTARQAASSAYDMGSDIYDRFLSPNRNAPVPTAVEDRAAALMEKFPGLSPKDALAQASSEAAKATPGMLARYGPIVAAGTGLAYAGGMFDPVLPEPPGIVPRETGFDLYNKNPEQYSVTPGGVRTIFAPESVTPGYGTTSYEGSPSGYGQMGNPLQAPQFRVRDPREYLQQFGFSPMGMAAPAPRGYNMGGMAKGGGIRSLAKQYPRRTGQISGPGTEKSDSIPAMLSDGEFVMTAAAVRGAGGGSRREGAKRMYEMMRKFERKA